MVTLPTKAHIGKRLTIALRDSHGNTRELLGILLDPKTIRTRDGASESFDPDAITNWRVVSEVATKAGRGAPLSMRVREIESVLTNTWPRVHSAQDGNWNLRFTEHDSDFANSVLPTGARPFGEPDSELDQAIADAVTFYTLHNQIPAIAIPLAIYPQLDNYLDSQGWRIAGETDIMVADTNDFPNSPQHTSVSQLKGIRCETLEVPTSSWCDFQGATPLIEVINRYPAYYLSVFIDEQQVAAARIAMNNGWGVITRVKVQSDYRLQGIGRLLIQKAAEVSSGHNSYKLALQVDSSNSNALTFFRSVGFRSHHRNRYRVPAITN